MSTLTRINSPRNPLFLIVFRFHLRYWMFQHFFYFGRIYFFLLNSFMCAQSEKYKGRHSRKEILNRSVIGSCAVRKRTKQSKQKISKTFTHEFLFRHENYHLFFLLLPFPISVFSIQLSWKKIPGVSRTRLWVRFLCARLLQGWPEGYIWIAFIV